MLEEIIDSILQLQNFFYSMNSKIQLFFRILRSKGEADGSGWVSAKCLMCVGCAVQSNPGHNSKFTVQLPGYLGHVDFRCLDGDNGVSVGKIFFSNNTDVLAGIVQHLQLLKKIACKG